MNKTADRRGPIIANSPNPPKANSRPDGASASFADLSCLEEAIVQAVAYSDIFDYPLTAAEIHRYLMETPATLAEVNDILSNGRLVPHFLAVRNGLFTLPGRDHTVETRRQRTAQSRAVWKRAFRFGRIIASLPFVHMVAVTGELAMDNVGPYSDIDYFIVTEPGRLWLTRLMVIAVVRCAGTRGPEICPNYLLSDLALELDDCNFYTAHEVAQMVPISGLETYRRLRDLNPWVEQHLPNAADPPRHAEAPVHWRRFRRLVEALLRTRLGARLERWEMERKIRKLTDNDERLPETAYSPDRCKGHVDGHGERILSVFQERWQAVKVAMQ
ncbi:hypothetical protein BH23CHL2_BH23CHL2_32860 [soil metagenome]